MNRDSRNIEIVLNVYDLLDRWNSVLYPFGLGAFHSGVQIGNTEYAFGFHEYPWTGIFEVEPRKAPFCRFRQHIVLGVTNKTLAEVIDIAEELGRKFTGNSYHIYKKCVRRPVTVFKTLKSPTQCSNCNHFSEKFAKELLGKDFKFPAWINRAAYLGTVFQCFIPKTFGVQNPQPSEDESSRNSFEDATQANSSNSSSFTPFSGTGMVLSQEMPALPPNHVEMENVVDAKRDLLAAAALKRLGLDANTSTNKYSNYGNNVNCLISEGIPDLSHNKIIINNNELMMGNVENLKRE